METKNNFWFNVVIYGLLFLISVSFGFMHGTGVLDNLVLSTIATFSVWFSIQMFEGEFRKKVKKQLSFWSQSWTIPLGMMIFWASPYMIHYIDPTAEVLTIGQYQKIIFVISSVFIIDGLVWFMIGLNFPHLFKEYKDSYGSLENLEQISPWEKKKFLLALLSLYLLSASVLAIAAAL